LSSPVIQALVAARLNEFNQRDAQIAAAVFAELGLPPVASTSNPSEFVTWCEARGVASMPARPATVALFALRSMSTLERLADIIEDISAAHVACGLADPTTTWPVPAAMSRLAKTNPPRSWPKEEKQMFLELPFRLQQFYEMHEKRREAVIRGAQNEAAELRKKLRIENVEKDASTADTDS
jgi:hypothetical protein